MKKILTILLSLALATSILAADFRGTDWGDGYKTIQKNEKSKKITKKENTENYKNYQWNQEIYSLKTDLKSAGTFEVKYTLLKDKLIKGSYSQEIKNGDFKNYNKVMKILNKKYGDSQNRYQTSFYESNGKKEVKNNKIVLSWYENDTKIDLELVNNTEFHVNYYTQDKELLKFIKETGLEKQRKAEKELMKDSEYIEKFL
ncbi:MAG: hypothetical protein WBG30_15245 [Psychrilyobacter sp.]|uniref:hypothetical protein n=1 Tax=Psychrilyobacter sp. TaxID=2586924 RepID=UPI003C78A3D2